MSEVEREVRYAETIKDATLGSPHGDDDRLRARAVIALADAEKAELQAEVERLRDDRAEYERWRDKWISDMDALDVRIAREEDRAESAEARVRELEAALQQSRDDHQGAVEKLRAVEALVQEWYAEKGADTDEGRGFASASRLCADELSVALASPVESDAEAEGAK